MLMYDEGNRIFSDHRVLSVNCLCTWDPQLTVKVLAPILKATMLESFSIKAEGKAHSKVCLMALKSAVGQLCSIVSRLRA